MILDELKAYFSWVNFSNFAVSQIIARMHSATSINSYTLTQETCHYTFIRGFYRAAAMHRGLAMSMSVCLSVGPSVCLSNALSCDKAKETSAHINIPYERRMHLVF